jgi:hypothetical protein
MVSVGARRVRSAAEKVRKITRLLLKEMILLGNDDD